MNSSLISTFIMPKDNTLQICQWITIFVHQISLFGMFEFVLKTALLSINVGLYGYILSHVFLYVCKIRLKYDFKDFVENSKKSALDSIQEIRESIHETLKEEELLKTFEKKPENVCDGCTEVCTDVNYPCFVPPQVQENGDSGCFRNPCPKSKKNIQENFHEEVKLHESLNNDNINLVEMMYEENKKKIS